MAKSKKPYPGLGLYVLTFLYDDTWVAGEGAQTLEKARKNRAKYPQWPDHKVKIVINEETP